MANKAKITKQRIDSLKPQKAVEYIWDTDVPGFCVAISKNGISTFRLQYRHAGRSSWFTIGRLGVYSIEQARDIARQKVVLVRDGVNPNEVVKALRKERKLQEVGTIDYVSTEFFKRWAVNERYKRESQCTYKRVGCRRIRVDLGIE